MIVHQCLAENVCKYYLKGTCQRGSACPNRHPTLPREKTVCRHWLRGLCRKDDACDFLHAYKADKIPECNSFALYGTVGLLFVVVVRGP